MDYVHLLMNEIAIKDNDAAYCVCQVTEWERNYKKGSEYYDLYAYARKFHADIIVVRFVENCHSNEFDVEIFKKEYAEFVDYLNGTGRAKIVLTSGFWKHSGDMAICEVAKERGYSFVYLGDLGERDDMKAIGLFVHNGVANHPGDKGMKSRNMDFTPQKYLDYIIILEFTQNRGNTHILCFYSFSSLNSNQKVEP